MSSRLAGVIVLSSLVILSGCVPEPVEVIEEVPEVVAMEEPVVVEEVRVPPNWAALDSLSPVEECKVPDRRVRNSGGSQEGQAVGFPVSTGTLPQQGSVNVIAAMVSFEDAPPSDLTAEGFFAPQLEKITQWSDFWSQGNLRYEFQMVDDWVRVPVNHADYPVNSREDSTLSRGNSAKIAQLVIDALPNDLDYAGADGFLIYWSPGIDEFVTDVATRGDDGVVLRTPDGPRGMFFWSGNSWHYTDTGAMTAQMKQDHTWSVWVYFMLLSQGLMLHSPGNGWATGLGQSQVPNPDFSGAITVWDAFRLGWVSDDQVQCISPGDLGGDPVQVMLTPQEVYGGDTKTIIIPLDARSDVLVIESRRPMGYSDLWPNTESGLLVYTVNPSVGQLDLMSSQSQRGCGNSDEFSKWAYYLYPDRVDLAGSNCKDFKEAVVREGDTLTVGGLVISLEFSDDELDYVSVQSVGE